MVPLINRKNELEIDNVFGLSTKHLKEKNLRSILAQRRGRTEPFLSC